MAEETADWVQRAVALRHHLHRHPELAWQEVETARHIRALLDEAEIPWRACADTGTVATLAPNATGRHIALRADIDALPVNEVADVSWISSVAGRMHACGHDGHTAALFAALWLLKTREAELPGPVTLLFQPAEEGGHGAKRMIEDGALDKVEAIYGWHNWPAIPYGEAVCPEGAVMAANGTFRITLQGSGGHASQPEACRDPVLATAAVVMALQQIVSRSFAPQQAVVVSVTSIDARSSETVVPDRAVLSGSIRIADPALYETLNERITRISQSTAAAFDVQAEVEHFKRYGATVNHPTEARRYRDALAAEFGEHWYSRATMQPIMASEDFSYYLNEIPGAFALIGTAQEDRFTEPCHSPRYEFNDALVPRVARIFLRLSGLEP